MKRYKIQQSPTNALQDNVYCSGAFLGTVEGPYRAASGSDFYMWWGSLPTPFVHPTGRNRTRNAAIRALKGAMRGPR